MTRNLTRKATALYRRAPSGVSYSRDFLERLARILVNSGHSPKRLARDFTQICRGLKEPGEPWESSRLNYIADLPHVIAHWHADAQYLDSRGAPSWLPLRSRGPSLTTLIRQVLPSADPADVVNSLMRLRGLHRRGQLYAPTGRYLAYNQQRTSALAHGLTALLGMLRTVEHNVSRKRGQTVLERAAMNPNFPVRSLPSFHRRLKRLASDFLWAIDGTMRRREGRRRTGPTTRLGVGVFAFEEPLFTGTGRGVRSARIKPRRGRGR